jgi:hypothetical protein
MCTCVRVVRLNAAPWLWLPEAASATDSYHLGLTSMVLDQLNPSLPVFFEFAHGLGFNSVRSPCSACCSGLFLPPPIVPVNVCHMCV